MGKLLDKLSRIGKASAPRMGFAPAATQKQPSLALIVALDRADKETAKAALQAGADAIVVMKQAGAKSKTPLAQSLGAGEGIPCGGDISEGQASDASSWDFALLGKGTTIEDANLGDQVDKVLWLPQPPNLELLQALEGLPVDTIAMDARNQLKPLTLEGLSAFHRVASATRKPLLASVTLALPAATLAALRDAGISGLIAEFASPMDAKKLETLRQAVIDLPPKKQKKSDARAALPLGLMAQATQAPATPDRDGDDD